MRTACLYGCGGLLLLVLVCLAASARAQTPVARDATTAGPHVENADEHTPVPVPVPTARAFEFYRTGNWLWSFAQFWTLGVLALLVFTGLSARMRAVAQRIGRGWYATFAIYLLLYMAVDFLADLPLRYYAGFVRQHAYGLSNQSLQKWADDALKGLAVSAVVGVLVSWVPLVLIERWPRRWWLITTILTVPFLFAVMLLKPICVDPLFNDFGPMKNERLEREILALAERARIEGSRIYEVNKSVDTKSVNAYVTGLFGTKRIVLWDTLLAKLDDREVLAVVGHEMGHYVLGHVPRTIALSTVATLLGLLWVDRAGRWVVARFPARIGFDRLSDVAAIPLLLLLLHAGSLALGPVANLYSRYQEHEADCFSLELTHMNGSTARAFAKLQQENLSNPYPGWFYRLWRSTHPSIGERIDFCNHYRPWATGGSLRYSGRFRP